MTIHSPTNEQYATFGRYVAATLGANTEWDGGDILEDVSYKGSRMLGRELGGQSAEDYAFWRREADALGIEHDGEENPDCSCEDYFDTSEAYDESNSLIASGEHEHIDAGLPGTDDLTGCAVAGCLCEHVAGWGRWL